MLTWVFSFIGIWFKNAQSHLIAYYHTGIVIEIHFSTISTIYSSPLPFFTQDKHWSIINTFYHTYKSFYSNMLFISSLALQASKT